MIEMGIDHRLMEAVLRGEKVYEGRLRTSKFVTLRVGDKISFREDVWKDGGIVSSKSERASAIITSTKFYNTFNDMLTDINYKLVLPDQTDSRSAAALYRRYYTEQQEKEYGVVAIGFKLI